MTAGTDRAAPLEGLLVVELTDGVAGAYAGRHLALAGADVIKVEPPEGDTVRRWGPFPATTPARWWPNRARCTST